VAITGRNQAKLETAFRELGAGAARLRYFVGDISKEEDSHALREFTLKAFGRIDVLINNAGMTAFGRIEDYDHDALSQVIDINLKGAIYVSKACLPELIKNSGSVFFVSSVVGLIGIPNYGMYSISKMGVRGIADIMRMEHGNEIGVGLCYVGFTQNDENKKMVDAEGNLVEVRSRPNRFSFSQDKTAQIILNQIVRRKFITNPAFLGKLLTFVLSVWPGFAYWILPKASKF
jgi:short-subunit dehydrogenase